MSVVIRSDTPDRQPFDLASCSRARARESLSGALARPDDLTCASRWPYRDVGCRDDPVRAVCAVPCLLPLFCWEVESIWRPAVVGFGAVVGSKSFIAKTIDGNINAVMTNVEKVYIIRFARGR